MSDISQIAEGNESLTVEQVKELIARSLPADDYAGKKILLVVQPLQLLVNLIGFYDSFISRPFVRFSCFFYGFHRI